MKIKILVILLLIAPFFLNGVIHYNGSEGAFEGSGGDDKEPPATIVQVNIPVTIRTLIIQGASAFLKSHAHYQLFLNQVEAAELSGPNMITLKNDLNIAVMNMEEAFCRYWDLYWQARITPYNQEVILKLKNFDYQGLLTKYPGINTNVFKEMQVYLTKGDVVGCYCKMMIKTLSMINQLYSLKYTMDQNIVPEITGAWSLNQDYSNALFFGQYIAMVFREL